MFPTVVIRTVSAQLLSSVTVYCGRWPPVPVFERLTCGLSPSVCICCRLSPSSCFCIISSSDSQNVAFTVCSPYAFCFDMLPSVLISCRMSRFVGICVELSLSASVFLPCTLSLSASVFLTCSIFLSDAVYRCLTQYVAV